MDCILAERFQKFVHIENFVNSIYKSFKFIIGTYNDDDTLPGKSFFIRPKVVGSNLTICSLFLIWILLVYHDIFGSKVNLSAFSDVETQISKIKIENEVDSLKNYISLQGIVHPQFNSIGIDVHLSYI